MERKFLSGWPLWIISLFFLYVVSIKWLERREFKSSQQPNMALYMSWICPIDRATEEPIKANIFPDTDSVSIDTKGAAATILQEIDDGSVVLAAIGKVVEGGMKVLVSSDGYLDRTITVEPDSVGIANKDASNKKIVRLERIP